MTPLVRSIGYELGCERQLFQACKFFSHFSLNMDSELLFVGDAGTTEASRPSKREGFEISTFYMPTDWMIIDLDYALTRARFTDADAEGNHIPGAIKGVGKAAVSVDNIGRFYGSMQFRILVARVDRRQ